MSSLRALTDRGTRELVRVTLNPILTHSWVVLAQCLLPDSQGIIEQVGSILILVLVPGSRQDIQGCPLARSLPPGARSPRGHSS